MAQRIGGFIPNQPRITDPLWFFETNPCHQDEEELLNELENKLTAEVDRLEYELIKGTPMGIFVDKPVDEEESDEGIDDEEEGSVLDDTSSLIDIVNNANNTTTATTIRNDNETLTETEVLNMTNETSGVDPNSIGSEGQEEDTNTEGSGSILDNVRNEIERRNVIPIAQPGLDGSLTVEDLDATGNGIVEVTPEDQWIVPTGEISRPSARPRTTNRMSGRRPPRLFTNLNDEPDEDSS